MQGENTRPGPKLRVAMVIATIVMFLVAFVLQVALLSRLEFARGINWVYLPAGVRLLAPLLFAEEGALGLLLASWGVSFLVIFPDDAVRAFVGGIVASLAPYAVYVVARRWFGLRSNLGNLDPGSLLVLAVAASVASPLLHHVWFAIHGDRDLLRSFVAMFVGDLNGTLIVLYGTRAALRIAMPTQS